MLSPGGGDADIDAMAYDLGLRPRQLEPRTYSEIVDEMSRGRGARSGLALLH